MLGKAEKQQKQKNRKDIIGPENPTSEVLFKNVGRHTGACECERRAHKWCERAWYERVTGVSVRGVGVRARCVNLSGVFVRSAAAAPFTTRRDARENDATEANQIKKVRKVGTKKNESKPPIATISIARATGTTSAPGTTSITMIDDHCTASNSNTHNCQRRLRNKAHRFLDLGPQF